MKWTRDKPTAPGWWWYRGDFHFGVTLVEIMKDHGQPMRSYWFGNEHSYLLEEVDGEWQGPLTPDEAE